MLRPFRRSLVSRHFLPDVPGFQVPPRSIFPPQLRSSSRALPYVFILTTARMLSGSSLLLSCPNHSNLLLLMTIGISSTLASSKISSFVRCSNRLTPIDHRTILIYVVAIRFSHLNDISPVAHAWGLGMFGNNRLFALCCSFRSLLTFCLGGDSPVAWLFQNPRWRLENRNFLITRVLRAVEK